MKRIDVTTKGWEQYALIDSGEGRKLEQFGQLLLDRPDPQALWDKSNPTLWFDAHAQFLWKEIDQPAPGGLAGEKWKLAQGVPESWEIIYGDLKFSLSFKGFKHVGLFPEHAHQWQEFIDLGKQYPGLRMLNLFGYSGAASIAGAMAGMEVTHVDASKSMIDTVKENTILSGLPTDAIRLVCEDALKYAKRLVQRKEAFEVIVMDPPAFGRGPKGEVWKIEESLHELIALVPQLLSPDAKLVILNGYASGYSARTFGELLCEVVPQGNIEYGDVSIQQKNADRLLTTGIYAAWKS